MGCITAGRVLGRRSTTVGVDMCTGPDNLKRERPSTIGPAGHDRENAIILTLDSHTSVDPRMWFNLHSPHGSHVRKSFTSKPCDSMQDRMLVPRYTMRMSTYSLSLELSLSASAPSKEREGPRLRLCERYEGHSLRHEERG